MKKDWENTLISKIHFALCVPPNWGKMFHKDRPFHGLVMEAGDGIKDYCFSDGRVMRTEGECLFYLPKNSTYQIKVIKGGHCYAINFDADIDCDPFVVSLRDADELKKSFKTACVEWSSRSPACFAATMRAAYDAIYHLQKETEKKYMPSGQQKMIAPALEAIERDFMSCDVTIEHLAKLCGVSEVYLRKIFNNKFGISPKEYVIRKRIEYAKHLLVSGHMSVSEVANLCGYTEPCHFSREFKKRTGISPRDFR